MKCFCFCLREFFLCFIILTGLFSSPLIHAQVLEKIQPFSAGTPFQESDGRKVTLQLPDGSFVMLSKTKGGIAGDAEGMLEKFDSGLNILFKTPIVIPDIEEYMEMYLKDKNIILISEIHNSENYTSTLKASFYDVTTGQKTSEKILQETKVNKWLGEKGKGAVKQSFENYAGAVAGQDYITPVDYQYDFRFSPDSSKILTYIIDYSQKTTIANACIFDAGFNKLTEGAIHIDNNFINYGLFINNGCEVIILNTDKLGRIVVVEYNLQTHANKFLDIQYTSARRESLKLYIVNNDILYVANLVLSSSSKLLAVMYAKFNFGTHLVEEVNFHEISDGLRETAVAARQTAKIHGDEDWTNYEITDFMMDDAEKIILVAEKRALESSEFVYDHFSVNDKDKWKETTGKVGVEGLILFGFNKKDELLFEDYCAKNQTADFVSSLSSASYVMNATHGKLRLLYTSSDSPSGIFNTIHFLEWDENNGTKLKDLKLPNPEGIGLMRNYTCWWKDRLVFAGKKGLMGKKSYLSSYKLID